MGKAEHLALIADRHGFTSIDPILRHPNNAALFRDRQPGILAPSEVVFIPDPQPAVFSAGTGQRHTFVRKILRAKVRIVVQSFGGQAKSSLDCAVDCDGAKSKVTTDAEGLIEFSIHPSATEATVTIAAPADQVPAAPVTLKVEIGGVGPVRNDDAALLRLRNLGYFRPCFPEEEANERKTAIEEFQLENGLEVTGELDDRTKQKLEKVYGC